jgi:hypothetical protein
LWAGGLGIVGVATTVAAAFLAGAGLAGSLATHGMTLAALGVALVAGAVAGVLGREVPARVGGWLTTVGSALGVAFTAARAVELVLQTAAVRHAAVVCTLWGLALGVRALLPGEAAAVRRGHVVAAAGAELGGWWLLLAAAEVATVEAYTLPLAAVALLAGWLARRGRDRLSSWAGYGPALAAALLPTLASVLVAEGQPVRRLLLGAGALAVVLAGARARLLAPVVSGGVVLAVTALHEVALVWDRLPRWIPLAAAGLLLVGLAMTVERRRRDLARLRAALIRMT